MLEKLMRNKLKQKIVKAVPEIMELKFGCYLTGEGLHNALLIRKLQSTENHYNLEVFVGNYETSSSVYLKENIKILGRKINLADVLVAILRKNHQGIMSWVGTRNSIKFFKYWNLQKDIEAQIDEKIQFLYFLLK